VRERVDSDAPVATFDQFVEHAIPIAVLGVIAAPA
jgi:hypothetical protein